MKTFVDGIEQAAAGSGGETTTASNLGAGVQVFAQLSGSDLQFRTVIGLSGISAVQSGNVINVAYTGAGGGGDNLGDHTATEDLNLASYDINNVGTLNATTLNGNSEATTVTNGSWDGNLLGAGSSLQAVFDAIDDMTVEATGGDNLGDHTATENLSMAGFNITSVGDIGLTGGITFGDATVQTTAYLGGDNLGNHVATQDINADSHSITGLLNLIGNNNGLISGFDVSGNIGNFGTVYSDGQVIAGYNFIGDGGAITVQPFPQVSNNILSNNSEPLAGHFGTLSQLHRAGSSTPDADFDVSEGYIVGTIYINTSNENAYICVYNAEGAATWEKINDDLGDHIATQQLDMGSFSIVGVDGISLTGGITFGDSTVQNTAYTGPDNLGNHTATQNINANSNSITGVYDIFCQPGENRLISGFNVSGLEGNFGTVYSDGQVIAGYNFIGEVTSTTSTINQSVSNNILPNTYQSLGEWFESISKLHRAGSSTPDADFDTSEGYIVGTIFVNTSNGNAYICVDNTEGAAVWKLLTFVI